MVTNATPTSWLAAMREIEHDGDVERDTLGPADEEGDSLWNAVGSRVQTIIDGLRRFQR